MKVSVEISSEYKEPYAVIYTDRMTAEVQRLTELFDSGLGIPITAQSREKMVILKPEEVYMVRVEDGDTVIYGFDEKYYSRKRLYELSEQLGRKFMQISKGTMINLDYMDSIEPGFGGTLLLKMKNGCKDYVSRTYLKKFKKYLGL